MKKEVTAVLTKLNAKDEKTIYALFKKGNAEATDKDYVDGATLFIGKEKTRVVTIALKSGTAGTGFTAVSSDCGNDYTGADGKVLLTRVPYSKRNDKTVVAAKLKKAVEKHLESLTNNEASLYEEHAVFKTGKEVKDGDYTDGGSLDIGGISKREQVTITIKPVAAGADVDILIGGTKKFKKVEIASLASDKELKTENVFKLAVPTDVSVALKALVEKELGASNTLVGTVAGATTAAHFLLLTKDPAAYDNATAIVADPASALKNGGTYYLVQWQANS